MRDLLDPLGRHACGGRDAVRREALKDLLGIAAIDDLRARVSKAVPDDDRGNAHRELAFLPRPNGDPLIGVGRRTRKPRVHMDEGAAADIATALAELTVASGVTHLGNPPHQEVGAKGQDVSSVGDVELGKPAGAKYPLDRPLEDVLVHGVELGMGRATQGLSEARRDHAHVPLDRVGYEERRCAIASVFKWLELALQGVHGLVPAHFLEPARAPAQGAHGASDPVGVVQGLDSSLSPEGQLPRVHGIVGIPLDLLRPAFDDADEHAAVGVILSAQGRVPVVDTSDQVLRKSGRALHEVLAHGWPAGRQNGCPGTGASQELQKCSSVQGHIVRVR